MAEGGAQHKQLTAQCSLVSQQVPYRLSGETPSVDTLLMQELSSLQHRQKLRLELDMVLGLAVL